MNSAGCQIKVPGYERISEGLRGAIQSGRMGQKLSLGRSSASRQTQSRLALRTRFSLREGRIPFGRATLAIRWPSPLRRQPPAANVGPAGSYSIANTPI